MDLVCVLILLLLLLDVSMNPLYWTLGPDCLFGSPISEPS